MIKETPKNKAITNDDVQEFHFAGTGIHPPMIVVAKDQLEAQAKYRERIGMMVVKSGYESEEKVVETD